jgi:uncharacterized protein (DUF1800 family)
MNRRSFVRQAGTALAARPLETQARKPGRVQSGLQPYAGPWTFAEAAHLLRRACFGATRAEILAAVQAGQAAVLNQLLTPGPLPAPPLNPSFADDPYVPVGETWVEAQIGPNTNTYRRRSLSAWSLGLLTGQPLTLVENMTLFWHNHFVIEADAVQDARHSYQYIQLLRSQALGNFRELAKAVTINPAMLRYLNGSQNTAAAPNENYARELFELFTIGKGPLIAEGNYTWYTEDDVKAAARVLTGWRDRVVRNAAGAPYSEFVANQHDTTVKQFSAVYGNAQIQPNGDAEYLDLIELIFTREETARHLCRKLYRWFVYYVIDETAEQEVIGPMAQALIDNGYEVAPVLRMLLGSEHFFDLANRGCLIKSPVQFTAGLFRQLAIALPGAAQLAGQYTAWGFMFDACSEQQQAYLLPPSVAGWPAYYQEPSFHELWINSVTLPARNRLTDLLITTGYRRGGLRVIIDPIAVAQQTSDPGDPYALVDQLVEWLFPMPVPASQRGFLIATLLAGIPDYEWTSTWFAWEQDPANATLRDGLNAKLQGLLQTMMRLAEFQLS